MCFKVMRVNRRSAVAPIATPRSAAADYFLFVALQTLPRLVWCLVIPPTDAVCNSTGGNYLCTVHQSARECLANKCNLEYQSR